MFCFSSFRQDSASKEKSDVAMTEIIDLSKRSGRVEVRLSGRWIGADLHLAIFGGDRPHIGAVALSASHPSLKNPEQEDVTTSVIAVTGHKEDLLARNAAQRIASASRRTTCVSCGIHLDEISKEEIRLVQALVEDLVDDFLHRLKTS